MSPEWQLVLTAATLMVTLIVHGIGMVKAFNEQNQQLKVINQKLDGLQAQGNERHAENQRRMDALERRMDRFEDRLSEGHD